MSAQLLMQAAESGDADVVESLLAESADVNEPLNGGETALIRAASNGHVETVKILLAKGADVNVKPANGMTALIRAAFFGHAEVVAALLERGADTTAEDPLGQTALKWATAKGHFGIVKLLKNAPPAVAADSPAIAAFTAPVPPPILSPAPSLPPPVLNASSDDEDEVTKISVRKIVLAKDVAAERVKNEFAAQPPPPMSRSILIAPVAASDDPTDDYSDSPSGGSLRRVALKAFAAALLISFAGTIAFYFFSRNEQPAEAGVTASPVEQPASVSTPPTQQPSVSLPRRRGSEKVSSGPTTALSSTDRTAIRGGESASPNKPPARTDAPVSGERPNTGRAGDASAADSAKAAKSTPADRPRLSSQNPTTGDDASVTPPQSVPQRRVAVSAATPSPTPASSASPAPKKKVIQWP